MSDAGRYRLLRELLDAASELEGGEREAFLEEACRGDDELRADLTRLLGTAGIDTRDLMPGTPEVATDPRPGAPPVFVPPERLGRYRIGVVLGQGAMGTVHEAVDEESGRPVAIKLVHPHLLDSPSTLERFLREARAGLALRSEHVVPTLDVDRERVEDRELHFLVMELVRGRTLRTLLSQLGTVPEALVREIGRQVAAGLAAIHEAGIVHRDLKPENILITDDRQVRIMDLGVAKLQEASVALTRDGQFIGSMAYAAPEQFEGGSVGPAADLYALGVVLHELLTGSNPFSQSTLAATVRSHLEGPRPHAADEGGDVSSFLGELLVALMAKKAEARPGPASFVEQLFVSGERGAWWKEREQGAPGVPRVQVKRHTKVHGRTVELEVLEDAWRAARSGKGRVLLLEGEAGLGKTRLVDAFVRRRAGEEANLLYGSFPPDGGLRGLADAVMDKLGEAGLEPALQEYLSVTPRLVPAFAAFLRREAPPEAAARLEGDAVEAVFCHLVRGLAREAPTLWVVDDLHFAPNEARAITLAMARALESHRILLLLTSRPVPPDPVLAGLAHLDNFRRIVLGPLSEVAVAQVLREAFDSDELADRLGAPVAKKTDGVPFFLIELLHDLSEGDYVRELPDGSFEQARPIEELDVPLAVADLIAERLRGLEADERAILDVAAVQGHEFDAELVAVVLGRSLVSVLQQLAATERAHGIVQASGPLYRFDHHQVQEVVYAQLAPRMAEEYHALLGRALVERQGDDSERVSGEAARVIASHHLRGGRPEEGMAFLLKALKHLEASYLSEEALALSERALGLDGLVEGATRVETLLLQASALEILGRRERQEATTSEAARLADELGDPFLRARTRLAQATLAMRTSQLQEALERFTEAKQFADEADDAGSKINASAGLGQANSALGRSEEALAQIASLAELAEATGDVASQALALGSQALVRLSQRQFDEAGALYVRSRALAIEAGDRRLEGQTMSGEGLCHWHVGRFEEALPLHERSLEVAVELGDRWAACLATGGLATVAFDVGDYARADRAFERHYRLALEVGERREMCVASLNRGRLFGGLGSGPRAIAHLERGRELARETGSLLMQAHGELRFGTVSEQLGLGTLDEVEEHFREAVRLFRESGGGTSLANALLALADRLLLSGREDEARTLLAEVGPISEATGCRISATLLACQRAELSDASAEEAEAVLALHEESLPRRTRLLARYKLWRALGSPSHLAAAHRLLEHARDHAPEDCRDSMIERVAMHRELAAAWAAQTG